MAAAQDFLDLWRSGNRQLSILAKISPRNISTLAVTDVRVGTDKVTTPAGSVDPVQFWVPQILSVAPINAPGGFGETSVNLCTGGLTLSPEFEVPAFTFLDGSAVSIWVWDKRLPSWDSALLLLSGVVVSWSRDGAGVNIQVRQRVNWNRDMTPIDVTAELYPHAPDSSIGQQVPIVYGKLRDVPMRRPWAEYPIIDDGILAVGDRGAALAIGGRRAGAAIMVDVGRGSGAANNPAAKVLCASHKVRRVGDHTFGAGFYVDTGSDRLGIIDVETPGTDIINTATEAGILLRDNAAIGWMFVHPTEVMDTPNTMENVRSLLDPFNDNNYARADYAAGLRTARLQYPAVQKAGDMVQLIAVAAYRSAANTLLQARIMNKNTGFINAPGNNMPTAANRTMLMVTNAISLISPAATEWDLNQLEIEVGWPTRAPAIVGTGTAEIFFVGFLINFRPRQEVYLTEQIVKHTQTRPVLGALSASAASLFEPYVTEEVIPAVTQAQGKFYANVDGWADVAGAYASEDLVIRTGNCISGQFTINFSNASQVYKDRLELLFPGDLVVARVGGPASGTVTSYVAGTGILTLTTANNSTPAAGFAEVTIRTQSALIETAPDVATHMLVNYGGESAAKVERTPGAFGSLVDARAGLKTYQGRDMVYALSVDKPTDVMTALSWMGQGSLSAIFLDRFTDKWRMRPWKLDAPVDYPWTFRPEDIVEPHGMRVSLTPLSSLSTGVQVTYSYSAHKQSTVQKNRVAWDGSFAGQKWRGVRDESMTVSTANNKLPWFVVGVSGFVGTLTSGGYSTATFAAHVDAVMKAADPARDYIVVHGADIVANYNDQIQFVDNITATTYTLTLTPGVYTFDSLCAYLTTIMTNAVGAISHPILMSYSYSTRQVSIQSTNRSVTLNRSSSPLRARRLLATLGFDQTAGTAVVNPGPVVAPFQREDACFIVGTNTHEIQLQWENSTFGLNGSRADCHSLLGFEGLRDVGLITGGAGVGTCHLGDSPKGDFERTVGGMALRYGAKRDTVVDARTIQESETARELRNRIARLTVKPRVVVEFATEMAPDIERTRVIQFHASMDNVVPYPDIDVGTSWLNKRFVVVETEQQTGPVAFYTKVRAVALD